MPKTNTTRKKVKIIGKETYINQRTQEVVEMNVIQESEKDANFHKIWIGHIIQALEAVGNQKIKVVNFIIENLNKDNQLIMTQRKISEKAGVSLPVVTETIKILIESNFLTKINSGAYRINPDVLFKGGTADRMNILIQYQNERATVLEHEEVAATEEVTAVKEVPMPEPTLEPEQNQKDTCPECGSALEVRKGKYGEFLGCPNYKKCGYKGKKASA